VTVGFCVARLTGMVVTTLTGTSGLSSSGVKVINIYYFRRFPPIFGRKNSDFLQK
jgi:hypothetical protein